MPKKRPTLLAYFLLLKEERWSMMTKSASYLGIQQLVNGLMNPRARWIFSFFAGTETYWKLDGGGRCEPTPSDKDLELAVQGGQPAH